jgi:hypothetical protein
MHQALTDDTAANHIRNAMQILRVMGRQVGRLATGYPNTALGAVNDRLQRALELLEP